MWRTETLLAAGGSQKKKKRRKERGGEKWRVENPRLSAKVPELKSVAMKTTSKAPGK